MTVADCCYGCLLLWLALALTPAVSVSHLVDRALNLVGRLAESYIYASRTHAFILTITVKYIVLRQLFSFYLFTFYRTVV